MSLCICTGKHLITYTHMYDNGGVKGSSTLGLQNDLFFGCSVFPYLRIPLRMFYVILPSVSCGPIVDNKLCELEKKKKEQTKSQDTHEIDDPLLVFKTKMR